MRGEHADAALRPFSAHAWRSSRRRSFAVNLFRLAVSNPLATSVFWVELERIAAGRSAFYRAEAHHNDVREVGDRGVRSAGAISSGEEQVGGDRVPPAVTICCPFRQSVVRS